MKPLIACLGVSGSGKTSLVNKVSKKYGYEILKSYTTREPRENDPADLNSHTFCDMKEAAFLSEQGQIVCSNWFAGNYYFCTKAQLQTADLYVVDCKGLQDLYRNYTERPIISIYLDVPPEIVAQRMEMRGDDNADILRRLQHDSEAFKDAKDYVDFVCDNSTQDKCNEICDFIDMLFRYYRG